MLQERKLEETIKITEKQEDDLATSLSQQGDLDQFSPTTEETTKITKKQREDLVAFLGQQCVLGQCSLTTKVVNGKLTLRLVGRTFDEIETAYALLKSLPELPLPTPEHQDELTSNKYIFTFPTKAEALALFEWLKNQTKLIKPEEEKKLLALLSPICLRCGCFVRVVVEPDQLSIRIFSLPNRENIEKARQSLLAIPGVTLPNPEYLHKDTHKYIFTIRSKKAALKLLDCLEKNANKPAPKTNPQPLPNPATNAPPTKPEPENKENPAKETTDARKKAQNTTNPPPAPLPRPAISNDLSNRLDHLINDLDKTYQSSCFFSKRKLAKKVALETVKTAIHQDASVNLQQCVSNVVKQAPLALKGGFSIGRFFIRKNRTYKMLDEISGYQLKKILAPIKKP